MQSGSVVRRTGHERHTPGTTLRKAIHASLYPGVLTLPRPLPTMRTFDVPGALYALSGDFVIFDPEWR
jgi:hypothetical protein